ncbi:hypothetical protein HDV00_011391 [Rhizophlyctis rosea]|nr:hypothetical protein HDV00_011391 [Rhizophlyctis rosea]
MSHASFHTASSQDEYSSQESQPPFLNNSQTAYFTAIQSSLEDSQSQYSQPEPLHFSQHSFLSSQSSQEPYSQPLFHTNSFDSQTSLYEDNTPRDPEIDFMPADDPMNVDEHPVEDGAGVEHEAASSQLTDSNEVMETAQEERAPQVDPAEEDPTVWAILKPRYGDTKSILLRDRIGGDGASQETDDGRGRKHKSGGYLFGRHHECNVRFEHPQMSNRHCLIFKETVYNQDKDEYEEVVILEDQSTNGVHINDKKLGRGKQQRLKNGDNIVLLQLDKGKLQESSDTSAIVPYMLKIPAHRNKKMDIESTYTFLRNLGSGNFATVKEAVDKTSGTKYAVKVINKSRFSKKPKFLENLRQEISILMGIEHPNVVRIYNVVDEPENVYIVLELVSGGELFDAIIENQKFSEEVTRSIMLQIFNALKYLHDRGITHRDLKPENILLTSKEPGDWRLKLSDFGLAKLAGEEEFMRTLCGTPNYVAPEVLTNAVGRQYTKAVDLWSCGVILYICLCGFPPFSEELAPPNMTDQIKQGKYTYISPFWDDISPEAKELIDGLLTVDPRERLTVDQALDHEWMKMSGLPDTVTEYTSSSQPTHAFTRGDTLLAPLKRTKPKHNPELEESSANSQPHSNPNLSPAAAVAAAQSSTPSASDSPRRSSRGRQGKSSTPPTRETTPDVSGEKGTVGTEVQSGSGSGNGAVSGTPSATPSGRGKRGVKRGGTREATPDIGSDAAGSYDGTPRRSKRIKKYI